MDVHDLIDDRPDQIAREYLAIYPVPRLRRATLKALTLMLLFGACDIALTYFVMRQQFIGPLGDFTGSHLELLAVSGVTLCAYYGMALLLHRGLFRPAVAVYVAIVAVLAFALWPTLSARVQDVWASGAGVVTALLMPEDATGAASAPLVLVAPLVFLWTCGYTTPGLLFIDAKRNFADCMELWRQRAVATEVLGQFETAEAGRAAAARLGTQRAFLNEPGARGRMVLAAMRAAVQRCVASVGEMRARTTRTAHEPETTHVDRNIAQLQLRAFDAWLEGTENAMRRKSPDKKGVGGAASVMLALLVLGSNAWAADTPATAEALCAAAPTLAIVVDVSGSSPVQSPAYVTSVSGLIGAKLRALPLCSTVVVGTAGDATEMPLMLRTRIQQRSTKDGASAADLARAIPQMLTRIAAMVREKPQAKSEIIGAIGDAARNFNAAARVPNSIVILSDMIEHSAFSDCSRARPCRLPKPPFSLKGAEVAAYGVGLGYPSERALALAKDWDRFFAQAGAHADLRRSF